MDVYGSSDLRKMKTAPTSIDRGRSSRSVRVDERHSRLLAWGGRIRTFALALAKRLPFCWHRHKAETKTVFP
jgi:hypothetical protein